MEEEYYPTQEEKEIIMDDYRSKNMSYVRNIHRLVMIDGYLWVQVINKTYYCYWSVVSNIWKNNKNNRNN